jgi:predicted aspartyl protease
MFAPSGREASRGRCTVDATSPHYDPPQVAQAPAPLNNPKPTVTPNNSASGDVPLIVDNNEALIVVMIGGRSLGMTLDTGASQGQLPTEFANALIADGAATEGEPMRFQMANGAVETNRTVIVNSVVIGSHRIYNVRFGLGSAALLGFNALSAVGTFKIDPVRGVLSFS